MSNELSRLAEDARQKRWEAEDRLAEVESKKEVVKKSAQEEIERLKKSIADEVAKPEAALRARQQERLAKLKRHCEDMKEVNHITSLANQSGGIKAYLEELNKFGTPISIVRLQSLADDNANYVAKIEKLDVVEVTDDDFQTSPVQDVEPSVRVAAEISRRAKP